MWTAIDTYAQRHDLTAYDDYRFFMELISGMDLAYSTYQRKKMNLDKTALGSKDKPTVKPKENRRGRP